MSSRKAVTRMQGIVLIVLLVIVGIGSAVAYQYLRPVETKQAQPLKFGVSMPLTGQIAGISSWLVKGYDMWASDINKNGGILGRPVQLIYYDDKGDPAIGAANTEKLITIDNVDFLFGSSTSGVVNAMAQIAWKHNRVFVNSGAASTSVYTQGNPWIFLALPGRDADYTRGLFDWIKTLPQDQKPKTAALLYENTLFPISLANYTRSYAQQAGVQLVYDQAYERGTSNWIAIASAIKETNAEALILGAYGDQTISIVKAVKAAGYKPKLMWSFNVAQDYVNALGESGDYIMANAFWSPLLKWDLGQKFAKAFQERYNTTAHWLAAGAYSGGQIYYQAITATSSVDNTVLRDYIRAHCFDTANGNICFDAMGLPSPPRMLQIQLIKGVQYPFWPKETAAREAIYPIPYT